MDLQVRLAQLREWLSFGELGICSALIFSALLAYLLLRPLYELSSSAASALKLLEDVSENLSTLAFDVAEMRNDTWSLA